MNAYRTTVLLLIASAVGCQPEATTPRHRQAVTTTQPAPATRPSEPTTQAAPREDDGGRSESQVLGRAFGGLLAECVLQIKKDTGKLPPGAKRHDFPVKVMEELLRHHRHVFLTTPRQEADFAADDFDDAGNQAAIVTRARQARQFHLQFPMMSRAILSLNKAGKLKDAELELARRILDAQFNAALSRLPGKGRESSDES
ncbi:MAG: hypothetical protein ACLFV7_04815 [Phycisphaerae bacterium]